MAPLRQLAFVSVGAGTDTQRLSVLSHAMKEIRASGWKTDLALS